MIEPVHCGSNGIMKVRFLGHPVYDNLKMKSLNEGLYWHTCECGENALDSSDGEQVENLYTFCKYLLIVAYLYTLLHIFAHFSQIACTFLHIFCFEIYMKAINFLYLPFVKGTLLSAIFASEILFIDDVEDTDAVYGYFFLSGSRMVLWVLCKGVMSLFFCISIAYNMIQTSNKKYLRFEILE